MEKELELIKELMHELQEKMAYGEDDFMERLGKKKPGIEVVKIEGKVPMDKLEKAEEVIGMDLDQDEEEGESEAHKAKVLGMGGEDEEEGYEEEESDPASDLKKRLMRLRG